MRAGVNGFTEQEILDVRNTYGPYGIGAAVGKMTLKQLAEKYNCGIHTIWKIVNGRSYTTVGGPINLIGGKEYDIYQK